jgi:hypothetical protein
VYIFNFDAKSWSKQTTSSAPGTSPSSFPHHIPLNFSQLTDLGTGTSVLDHDTNVFFTLPSGASASLYQLDLNIITNAASSSAVAWEAVSSTSFQQGAGEGVVMAEASNHISMSSGVVMCWY